MAVNPRLTAQWLDPIILDAMRERFHGRKIDAIVRAIAEHSEGSRLAVHPRLRSSIALALMKLTEAKHEEHRGDVAGFVRGRMLDYLTE